MTVLLEVSNLRVELTTRDGIAPVIDNLSLELHAGETLSLVGESGCGKSMTALALMGLLPEKVGRISAGKILFNGEDLTKATSSRLNEIRGNDISMIFQEPMTSLNPVYSIGEQIAEVLRRHRNMDKSSAWNRAIELLDSVRIPNPKSRAKDYPHQLSGGQRQRVMIAIALACEPKILIADEPTTALDVTVQAQIFDLMRDLASNNNTATILITHDMGAVAEMADRMIVMYAGRMAEAGPVQQVIDYPRHPYTAGLVSCVPHLQAELTDVRPPLAEIDGIVPGLKEFGRNQCLFASRCIHADDQCLSNRPTTVQFSNDQHSACWQANEI